MIENNIKTEKKNLLGRVWKNKVFFKDNKLVLTSITGKQSWNINKNSIVYMDREWGKNQDEVVRYWRRVN